MSTEKTIKKNFLKSSGSYFDFLEENRRKYMETSLKFTIDFDNTCALETFPTVGKDVPLAAETLSMLVEKGHKLILWTCRSGKQLEEAVNWFKNHNIELYGVNEDPEPDPLLSELYGIPRKVIGNFNIDDRNFGTPIIQVCDTDTNLWYNCVDWEEIQKSLKELGII